MSSLHDLTAAQAVAEIRGGRLSPVELVDALLARIEALEPDIRAWETVDAEGARAVAHARERELRGGDPPGPLHGVPVGLKDIYFTAGMRTSMSSAVYRDFIPDQDAAAVARLRAAGAIVLGKTVTTEFATGDPPRTRNPWNHAHTPGGSSSGSAAAVAARMCPLATGSQTAGSVCRPAAYNGIVGLKPTYGRVSRFGVFPVSWSLDTLGWMTRDVTDAALVLDAVSGFDERDPATRDAPAPRATAALEAPTGWQPRIGVAGGFFAERADAEMAGNLRGVADRLAGAGAAVEPFKLPDSFDAVLEAQVAIDYSECALVHRETFMRQPDDYAPNIRSRIEAGFLIPASAYLQAQRVRRQWRSDMQRALEDCDALLTPSTPTPPAADLSSTGDPMFQAPWTMAGLPEITLPTALSRAGLPMGVQLVARAWDDSGLLRTARWVERALDVDLGMPRAIV